ncbi:MAG: acyltransferase [Chitinophagaceae bacterium]
MAETGYIKSLDGVRAIAILLVMTFHAELTHYGWIGVQLFFVLSGYLIIGILWKEKSKTGESLGFKFKKFWVRRSLRIFPLYYGYIAVLGITYLVFNFPSYFESCFPYLVSYTANFPLQLLDNLRSPLINHLWSLSIEEQFYLFIPLFILLWPLRFTKKFLLVIIFLSPFIRFLWGEYYINKNLPELVVSNGVNFNTLCQLDAFCMGGIISVFSLDKRIKKPAPLFVGSLLAVIVFGLINFLTSPSTLNYFEDLGYHHYFTGNYQYIWQYTLLNIFFASLVLFLVSPNNKQYFIGFRRMLENKWMIKIGKVSYGMYIYHWLIWVYLFMKPFNPENYWVKVLLFIPYTIVVYLFSELSYRLFEYRFIKLKDRLFPPKNTTTSPATPSLAVNLVVEKKN